MDDLLKTRMTRMGSNLREFRKACLKESMAEFAVRLGITDKTLEKMEKGSPGVAIGTWVAAWEIMGVGSQIESVSRAFDATLDALIKDAESRQDNPFSKIG